MKNKSEINKRDLGYKRAFEFAEDETFTDERIFIGTKLFVKPTKEPEEKEVIIYSNKKN